MNTTAYEAGRLARRDGCYRLLFNPSDSDEEDSWKKGWDDQDAEIRAAELEESRKA